MAFLKGICFLLFIQHVMADCLSKNNFQSSFSQWKQGENYKIALTVQLPIVDYLINWHVKIKFTQKLEANVRSYQCIVSKNSKGKDEITLSNESYNGILVDRKQTFNLILVFKHKTNGNFIKCLQFCGITYGDKQICLT